MENTLYDIKMQIKENLQKELHSILELSDEAVWELIEEEIVKIGKTTYIPLAFKEQLRKEIFDSVRKYDILQELIEDSSVTEIMVNGKDNIFIEREGKLYDYNRKFESNEKLFDVIQQIVGRANRVVNETNPVVDARLLDGSRVHVVLPPIALDGPILTIRRFPQTPIQMENLLEMGSITKEVAIFLEKLVIAGYNIVISGGTGSGKTTFLNVLSGYIPKRERIITIEDSAELKIQGVKNLVRMETRNANSFSSEISIRDLIKASLRMRPDRIIVGEVRGAEALDMLQALNTGHDGSISTGHANSAKDMLTRLETMVLMAMDLPLEAVRRQIASGVDLIIHLGRMRDKTRKVLSITEITGFEKGEIQTTDLFLFEENEGDSECVEGKLVQKHSLLHTEKLKTAGIWEIE